MTQECKLRTVVMFLMLGLALRGPVLLGHALSNLAMIALRNAPLSKAARLGVSQAPTVYSLYGALHGNEVKYQITLLRSAATLDPNSSTIRWGLARTALAMGDAATAAEALKPIAGQAEHNLLLYQDALIAFSRGGMPDQAIALYESIPPPSQTKVIRDTMAVAYLEKGQQALEEVKQLRPGDLYVNYHLWTESRRSGDLSNAAACREMLAYFPLEAISPSDVRLLNYVAEVIPALLEEKVWDRERTLNVVSFLVWQYNEAAGVERLLEQLVALYPTESDWPFYLAELYHRRGELQRAEVLYQRALLLNPAYAQTYLRLGMIAEAKSQASSISSGEWLEQAVTWYERYREMVPDDLLALRRLAETYEALNYPTAAAMREDLEAQTDDRRIVAEVLNVPVENIELGTNLVQNGDLEHWVDGRPKWWIESQMANARPFGAAASALGCDEFGVFDGKCARIQVLWTRQQEQTEPPRVGYWYLDEIEQSLGQIRLQPKSWYLLSLDYAVRMESQQSLATVWGSGNHQAPFALEHSLPVTDGRWAHMTLVAESPETTTWAGPLIRSWSAGTLYVDNVRLARITLVFRKGL